MTDTSVSNITFEMIKRETLSDTQNAEKVTHTDNWKVTHTHTPTDNRAKCDLYVNDGKNGFKTPFDASWLPLTFFSIVFLSKPHKTQWPITLHYIRLRSRHSYSSFWFLLLLFSLFMLDSRIIHVFHLFIFSFFRICIHVSSYLHVDIYFARRRRLHKTPRYDVICSS